MACTSGATVLGVIKVHHFCSRGVVAVACTAIAPRKWRTGREINPDRCDPDVVTRQLGIETCALLVQFQVRSWVVFQLL